MSKNFNINIECESPHYYTCECCQENFARLTRFVYQNNDVFAYYYSEINCHNDNHIKGLIVICEFDDNDEIVNKIGFPFALWNNHNFVVTTHFKC